MCFEVAESKLKRYSLVLDRFSKVFLWNYLIVQLKTKRLNEWMEKNTLWPIFIVRAQLFQSWRTTSTRQKGEPWSHPVILNPGLLHATWPLLHGKSRRLATIRITSVFDLRSEKLICKSFFERNHYI